MSFRFNAPPGWPTPPEGWMPPPGWRPNPAWSPPPAGWQFYVEENPERLDELPLRRPSADTLVSVPFTQTRLPGAGRRSWATRHRLLIGSSAAVLVLAGAAAYGSNGPGIPTVTTVAMSSTPAGLPSRSTTQLQSPTSPPVPSSPPTVAPAEVPGTTTAAHRSRTPRPGTATDVRKPNSGTMSGGSCGAPTNPFGYTFCGGSLITKPASAVCRYFHCTSSFWDGQGYMVQCQDGTVSLSGGRRWACSTHHGVRRPVFRRA